MIHWNLNTFFLPVTLTSIDRNTQEDMFEVTHIEILTEYNTINHDYIENYRNQSLLRAKRRLCTQKASYNSYTHGKPKLRSNCQLSKLPGDANYIDMYALTDLLQHGRWLGVEALHIKENILTAKNR